MVPLDFPVSKQVFLGFSQHAAVQSSLGRKKFYLYPWFVLFAARLNNEIT